jgi:putative MATE family efflux protein
MAPRMSGNDRPALTSGPIGPLLLRLTIPMVIALLGRVAFNLVDTFFVGKLGTPELAAMGFTFPVVLFVTSISLGLGVGASATVSRAIGSGDRRTVRRLTTDALVLSFLIVTVLCVAGLLTIRPLFRLLGADALTMPHIVRYMRVWYIGVPFVVIPMVGNNAIRATGDTRTPMLIMLISVAVNIGLDPLLIFGIGPFPRMEIAGAALATVIARMGSLAISLYILGRRDRMLTREVPGFREIARSWGRIVYIGLPAAVTNLVVPLSTGFLTRMIAEHGPKAVAGLGVAIRIEMFVVMILEALATVLIPFVGQNWGARNMDRVASGMRTSYRFSLAWGALMFVVFLVAAAPIARIFNTDTLVVETTRLYVVLVSTSYGLYGWLRLAGAALNALNRPLPAALLAVARMLVCYVPLSYLGGRLYGMQGMFLGVAVANVIAGVTSRLWLRREIDRTAEQTSTALDRIRC